MKFCQTYKEDNSIVEHLAVATVMMYGTFLVCWLHFDIPISQVLSDAWFSFLLWYIFFLFGGLKQKRRRFPHGPSKHS